LHVLIRFGRWVDIIATPLPADRELFCVTTAMIHYAKAVAHAATGNVAVAEEEARHFDAAFAKVPPSRYVFMLSFSPSPSPLLAHSGRATTSAFGAKADSD